MGGVINRFHDILRDIPPSSHGGEFDETGNKLAYSSTIDGVLKADEVRPVHKNGDHEGTIER